MSRKKPLREQLRAHIERERLDDADYERLAGLFRDHAKSRAGQRPGRHVKARWWPASVAIAASAVVASVIVALALVNTAPPANDVAPRIAEEVLTNHLKIHVPDVSASSVEEVGALLDRLDFTPVLSTLIDTESLQLVGARYCTLQGAIATQLMMVDRYGNSVTHYQAAFEPGRFGSLPRREAGDEPLVLTRNGVTIEIWVESGVTMAKARSVALEL